MCEELEWLAWQQEAEQRVGKEKAAELKNAGKIVAPPQPVEPQTQQEEPAPA
jgi:hypothetical protein